MLSIPNRAAVCFFGFALSGCMQSMPTAEMVTRPTVEAFTRLSSWTPWRSSSEPPPVVVVAENPAPAIEPVEMQPKAPEMRLQPKPKPKQVERAPQLASTRARPVSPAPAITPAAMVSPAAASAPKAAEPAPAPLLPAKVVCQTANQPGERVRMECTPVE